MKWAVLLAGGSGTRFWPLSTPDHPKQLLPLTGSASSAEEAVERLTGLIPRERILVVAGAGLAPKLQARLQLPAENVLVELIRNDHDLYRIVGSNVCGTLNPGASCTIMVEYDGFDPIVGFDFLGDGELIWIAANGAPARTVLDGTP